MISGTSLTVYLWKNGNVSRNVSRTIIIMKALTGFGFLAPLMPMEFTVTIATGIYFINLREYTGIYDFFSLGLTPVSSSLLLSLNYRP